MASASVVLGLASCVGCGAALVLAASVVSVRTDASAAACLPDAGVAAPLTCAVAAVFSPVAFAFAAPVVPAEATSAASAVTVGSVTTACCAAASSIAGSRVCAFAEASTVAPFGVVASGLPCAGAPFSDAVVDWVAAIAAAAMASGPLALALVVAGVACVLVCVGAVAIRAAIGSATAATLSACGAAASAPAASAALVPSVAGLSADLESSDFDAA